MVEIRYVDTVNAHKCLGGTVLKSANKRGMRTILAGLLALSGFAAIVPNAVADSFYAMPDVPTVELIAVPNNFQPASPRSTATYTLTAAVGSQGSVDYIHRVYMCWTKPTDGWGDPTNADCYDANFDPRYEFLMIWQNDSQWDNFPDDWFFFGNDSNYANANSVSNYGNGTANSMNMNFKFHVSESMLMGTDWQVAVTAEDADGQSSTRTAAGKTTLYYGAVLEQPNTYNYGQLGAGQWTDSDIIDDGGFQANGASDLTYETSAFEYNDGVNPSYVIPVATGAVGTDPAAGKVSLDCTVNDWFNVENATRITGTPVETRTNYYVGGVWEGGDWYDFAHTCRLTFGGGAPVANQNYNSTFTIGIGAH